MKNTETESTRSISIVALVRKKYPCYSNGDLVNVKILVSLILLFPTTSSNT